MADLPSCDRILRSFGLNKQREPACGDILSVYLPLIDKAEPCRLLPETLSARRVRGLVIRFLVLLFCFGTGLLSIQSHASAETRSLKIYHVHTGEKAVITYKRNGHYIKAGLNKLDYILRDWRKDKQIDMDPRMLDLLWEVYQKSGSHDYIHIICGYRTGDTNSMLRGRSRASGVAKKSQHILGKAIDFYIPDVPLSRLREIGMKFQVGGVGYYPNSGSPFVHMDTGWVRAWPRMSRQQLVKLFPNGHTLHLPPDGKPLPGYQEALVDYKRRVDGNSIMVAGGGSSGRSSGGGNLLAALFGGGDEDEELGADDTVQTDPSLHRIERKAMAPRAVADRSKAVPPVALPKPSDAPLPGVRPVAIASAEPQQAAPVPTPPAEVQVADAGETADQKYPDLLAYAIPVPQLLPDRSGSDSAQDATAALIADANADMPPDDPKAAAAEPDTETILAMVPVPEMRPELTAYAPTEEPQPAFAKSFETKPAKVAPETATPKLRPSDIARAVRKNAHVRDKIIMASIDPVPAINVRPELKPAEPKPFDTVSGTSVRGGRVGAEALTKDAIADWAQARREAGTLKRPFAKGAAAPRMNRLPSTRAVAEEDPGEAHIDPQRFAAVSVYFPND